MILDIPACCRKSGQTICGEIFRRKNLSEEKAENAIFFYDFMTKKNARTFGRFESAFPLLWGLCIAGTIPFQQIIQRHVKIIGNSDQRLVIGFPLIRFVPTDRILAQMQIHRKLHLRNTSLNSQFFQSHRGIPLDSSIPIWYSVNIPIWYI